MPMDTARMSSYQSLLGIFFFLVGVSVFIIFPTVLLASVQLCVKFVSLFKQQPRVFLGIEHEAAHF